MTAFSQKAPSYFILLLTIFASVNNANANAEFSDMLNRLDEIPAELSPHDIGFNLIKKNNRLPSHLFYGSSGNRVLGIGKLETLNTYVVLVGDVFSTALNDFNLITVHGYNFTKQGKFINREPFMCIAGVVPSSKLIHSCKISFKNKPVLSVWKESIQNAKTTRQLDTYIINSKGELTQTNAKPVP